MLARRTHLSYGSCNKQALFMRRETTQNLREDANDLEFTVFLCRKVFRFFHVQELLKLHGLLMESGDFLHRWQRSRPAWLRHLCFLTFTFNKMSSFVNLMETVKSVETVFKKLHYVWRCDELSKKQKRTGDATRHAHFLQLNRQLNVLHSMPKFTRRHQRYRNC